MLNLRSQREIRLMRKPGLLVWQAHRIAAEMVRPGITTGEIDAAIERLFDEHSAIPLFKGVHGKVPFPAVACISVNEAVVHGIPGDRVLKEGDIVSIDTGCKLDGWCGDAAATYPVGRVDHQAQRLLEITRGTLDLAIDLMGSRSRWSEVAHQIAKFVEGAGFAVVEKLVGHGIGRKMHEDPQVPNFANNEFLKKGDFSLKPGLVVAIEPMVNAGTKEVKILGDHWTQVTADGKYSAHFEHTVALTKDGPRLLTGPPQDGEEMR